MCAECGLFRFFCLAHGERRLSHEVAFLFPRLFYGGNASYEVGVVLQVVGCPSGFGVCSQAREGLEVDTLVCRSGFAPHLAAAAEHFGLLFVGEPVEIGVEAVGACKGYGLVAVVYVSEQAV